MRTTRRQRHAAAADIEFAAFSSYALRLMLLACALALYAATPGAAFRMFYIIDIDEEGIYVIVTS